ncbi:MAG: heme-binding Shp domain-containing protein [Peptostreptococcaceae bacterium]|nr:heme-binding Shp domain-containing protein [Peptostreptococcaceae bacterium]
MNILKKLMIVLTMGWLLSGMSYADTVEIASVTAHYKHPVTGAVEDSGNDIAIGQGMTESVLDPQALIEVDGNGKIYGTFRLHLADQINSYKISVQKSGNSEFYSVSTTEMQRKDNSIDFRIALPSKQSILRIDAFVNAMGRSVIFYGKIGSLVEGNTDFIVSVDPTKKDAPDPVESQAPVETSAREQIIEEEHAQEQEETQTPVTPEEPAQEQTAQEERIELTDPHHGLLMKGDPRLGGDREAVHSEQEAEEKIEVGYGPFTMMMITSLVTVLGMFSLLTLISGIGVMIYFYLLRKNNDRREARLYGFNKKE